MVSVVELQILSVLWLEKFSKISLSRTHCIDAETRARQRIQENLKLAVQGTDEAKEQTAKRPDKMSTGMPCVECGRIPSNFFSELR